MMMKPIVSLYHLNDSEKITCLFCNSKTDFFYLSYIPICNNFLEEWRGIPVCQNCHEKIQKDMNHFERIIHDEL